MGKVHALFYQLKNAPPGMRFFLSSERTTHHSAGDAVRSWAAGLPPPHPLTVTAWGAPEPWKRSHAHGMQAV